MSCSQEFAGRRCPRVRFACGSSSSLFVALVWAVALASILVQGTAATTSGNTAAVAAPTTTTTTTTMDDENGTATRKQRGKLLNERFDEHDLLRAYQEIKAEYREKAFGGSSSSSSGTHHHEGGGDNNNNGDDDWRVLNTMNPNKGRNSDDDEIIRVSMLEHPSDPLCPYVKMETVIPVPVARCWDFLSLDRWDETMPKMDPFYEGLDVYGEYGVKEDEETNGDNNNNENTDTRRDTDSDYDYDDLIRMVLARKRTKRILAFGKREFVFVSVEDKPLEDGTWVSGTVSVEIDESSSSDNDNNTAYDASLLSLLRRNKSYTRAFQDSVAFYKPFPSATTAHDEASSSSEVSSDNSNNSCDTLRGRTKLTIVCRIDLNDSNNDQYGSGGCIPMWLYVKTIGATGARSVLNMRKCLLADYSCCEIQNAR